MNPPHPFGRPGQWYSGRSGAVIVIGVAVIAAAGRRPELPPECRRTKAYAFRMDDEWRVRVTGWGERAPGKPLSAHSAGGLLRGQVGAEVPVSTGKAGVLRYAPAADAAATVACLAQEQLARQGLAAQIAIERWEPSRQVWLPPGDAVAELPSEQDRGPGHRRLRAVGGLTAFIIDACGRSGA
jgi:hypothetical protein